MSSSRCLALLVGVNDYLAAAVAGGRAPGALDLRGSLNNVDALGAAIARAGVAAEDMTRLTAPATPGARPATVGQCRVALARLADLLAEDADAHALIYFSGHGCRGPDGGLRLLAADSDVEGEHAVGFDEILSVARAVGPGRVSVFLDCCHADAALAAAAAEEGVLLAAAAQSPQSQEHRFHGRWYGAFTWGLTAVLERWRAHDGAPQLSYEELLRRTARLLSALDVEQRPGLRGGAGLRERVFLGRLPPIGPAEPAPGARLEIEAGGVYILYDIVTSAGQVGYLMCTDANDVLNKFGYDWTAKREYWIWTGGGYSDTNWPDDFSLEVSSFKGTLSNQGSEYDAAPFSGSTSGTLTEWWEITYSNSSSTVRATCTGEGTPRKWFRESGQTFTLLEAPSGGSIDFSKDTGTLSLSNVAYVNTTKQ